MLTFFAAAMATAGVTTAGLAAYVAWRRDARMGWSLAILLLAVAWWGVAYAVELGVDDIATKSRWGDLKYFGITTLAPAWLIFVLQYTGRDRWVTKRLLGRARRRACRHDAVAGLPRHPRPGAVVPSVGGDRRGADGGGRAGLLRDHRLQQPRPGVGDRALHRQHGAPRTQLPPDGGASCSPRPWSPGPPTCCTTSTWVGSPRIDLTPFAFILTGGVLVWGLFHERLVDLAPLARSAVLERMADAVYVTDPFGRDRRREPGCGAAARDEPHGAARTAPGGRRRTQMSPPPGRRS